MVRGDCRHELTNFAHCRKTSAFLSDRTHPELRLLAVDFFETVAQHGGEDAVFLKVAEIGGTLCCGARLGHEGDVCAVRVPAVQPAHAIFDLGDARGDPAEVRRAGKPSSSVLSFVGPSNTEGGRQGRIHFCVDPKALHAPWESVNMRQYCRANEFAVSCVRILRRVLAHDVPKKVHFS